jgi:hypothetical protein
VDGHPSSSKLDLFEGFSQKIVEAVRANPSLWRDTAIFITFDRHTCHPDRSGGICGFTALIPLIQETARVPHPSHGAFSCEGWDSKNVDRHTCHPDPRDLEHLNTPPLEEHSCNNRQSDP